MLEPGNNDFLPFKIQDQGFEIIERFEGYSKVFQASFFQMLARFEVQI